MRQLNYMNNDHIQLHNQDISKFISTLSYGYKTMVKFLQYWRTINDFWNDQLPFYQIHSVNTWTRAECLTAFRYHDDVIKWKHFPRDWPFVRGIHRWPVNSPHKGQWRGALMFSFICLNRRLSKQWWSWWFEMPLRPLWLHRNEVHSVNRSYIVMNFRTYTYI